MNYEVSPYKPTCPLCGKFISDWSMASGKCVFLGDKLVHVSCVQTVRSAEIQIDGKKTA